MSTERTDPVVVVLNCEAQPSIDTAEIDRAEWNAMTPAQRAAEVQTLAAEHMNNAGGYGWHIADETDAAMVGELPRPIDADAVMQLVVEYGAECGIHSPLTAKAADLVNKIHAAVAR